MNQNLRFVLEATLPGPPSDLAPDSERARSTKKTRRPRSGGTPIISSLPGGLTAIATLIEQKKNHTYKAAVDLMARIEVLATGAKDSARFDNVLARARTEHRAKRNLKKLLDARGWPDPRTKP